MLPLGHMGITLFIVQVLPRRFRLQRVDYRLLLVGAVFPDIIDKPLGYLLSANHALGGKAYGHSLSFLLLLCGIGLIVRRKGNTTLVWLLLAGSTTHDILDVMWNYPKTLFWPFYGWKFSNQIYEVWEGTIRFGILHLRQLVAFEILGGSILLYVFVRLALNNKIIHFIKTGELAYTCSLFQNYTKTGK